jgi:hypothetical protein
LTGALLLGRVSALWALPLKGGNTLPVMAAGDGDSRAGKTNSHYSGSGLLSAKTITYIDESGNLIIQTVTVAGLNYNLLSATNLSLPMAWFTNSNTAGTGGTITDVLSINPAQGATFLRYLAE